MVGILLALALALAWIGLVCNMRVRQYLHRCLPSLALAGWFLLLLLLFMYVAFTIIVSY